jgi:hypothetical protein
MKPTKLILALIFLVSCNDGKLKENQTTKNAIATEINNKRIKNDTTKLYQKVKIIYGEEKKNSKEFEGYVSKEKDTIWNEWKIYKNGIIDSLKSKFYELKIEGNKGDSVFKGIISFYSPGDSIRQAKIDSRKVSFTYLQEENDSLIFKEIQTDQNIIEFEYKDFDNLSFVGYISDLRFVKIDSLPEKLLVNRNYFAIDSEASTNNTFIELLK